MPLPQQDEFGAIITYKERNEQSHVSMPLPQQDEFGASFLISSMIKYSLSQCRFRSKMNSEHMGFIH